MVKDGTSPYLGTMLKFATHIDIDAPAHLVWEVLVDTQAWSEWDPYCDRIEAKGPIELGRKVKAFTKLAPGRGFGVKVSAFEPGKRMVWSGGMPLGLFKGERTFELISDGSRTRFEMQEVFSGPMLKLIAKSLPDLNGPFDAFAAGLKDRVEQRAHAAAA